jgi:hypothetical protein
MGEDGDPARHHPGEKLSHFLVAPRPPLDSPPAMLCVRAAGKAPPRACLPIHQRVDRPTSLSICCHSGWRAPPNPAREGCSMRRHGNEVRRELRQCLRRGCWICKDGKGRMHVLVLLYSISPHDFCHKTSPYFSLSCQLYEEPLPRRPGWRGRAGRVAGHG